MNHVNSQYLQLNPLVEKNAMLFKSPQSHSATPETIIGPSIRVEGQLIGEGNVTVEGSIMGMLKTTKDVYIGDKAKLQADIEAQNIIIAGEIKGNVKVYGKIEIKSSARIIGDIEAGIISVETGAMIKGKCVTGVTEKATVLSQGGDVIERKRKNIQTVASKV
ncbi:MAG: hypothetical protein A3B74_05390 [Candidatus Kerfeldbacteria bacterium RIFCSPHIGHO2_02_FULL_42_14]|uniref:Cell shape determination protein CcmA n=1 Tax=Candidatus Kerfeldbacteria bacterium RIFCSPHIGHO2_02_FULL_42_14 TaxID=1798540 RepID=A0A1G2AT65_9BACT|nr:MAG: hypothetical protein A3B74_05390 [Candidatus Kerfeldbacteria bacterium RIFCSPHIGHO2_02_FULL_42_14]OGY81578.1 MAG: hypothetical protein A3E60_01850 [Candidatus Kerfeldbacteria bacterium RIFCSPHIGHO2_12_FULL_42_13]OGY83179.1 MAG: hypothetical protein A3I91_03265 [Candidatus Kerfeldbacteria bacterium RIFCSPLOWO2_02_FULL_42_19]OGY86268.1 MAG: hypothetical protein A3G01_00355 [Candidatus Kerfeldbacteria bacterium RIFCSPLOWO2_12_FULL_43_9]